MTNRRFVKSYPDWVGSAIWKDDALFKLYHYCMYKACYTGMKWKGLQLEPGEFPMAQRNAAEELGWSVSFLRKNLETLVRLGVITIRTNRRGTVIRIAGEEKLQDSAERAMAENTGVLPVSTECTVGKNTGVSPGSTKCAMARHTGVLPGSTYIEYTEKESVYRPDENAPAGFLDFWRAYPADRRSGLDEAARCYADAIRSGATPETLMMILAEDKASAAWRKENGRYIPGMVKWFEKEKWRDRVPEPRGREDQLWKSR